MRVTATTWISLRTLVVIVGCSAIGGAFFGVAMTESEGIPDLGPALIGAYNGCLISLLIGSFELYSPNIPALYWLKRAPLLAGVLLRSVVYIAVFTLVIQSSFIVMAVDPEGWHWRDTNFLITVGLSFGVSIAFNAIVGINQMLGRGVLIKFLSGYYYRPREEQRIFMFIDLVGSTALAERIGHLAFHRLLNDFIRDATEPILASRGEIHDYVGDEIIVSWKPSQGLPQSRCVRCFLDIRHVLEAHDETYRDRYGISPRFRAALHMGPVVVGQLGVVKQAIVFLGDTVNTTARIEATCRELDAQILVSADVVDRLEVDSRYAFVDAGPVALRGKSEPIRLYRLAS